MKQEGGMETNCGGSERDFGMMSAAVEMERWRGG